jgi:hypothetical protein
MTWRMYECSACGCRKCRIAITPASHESPPELVEIGICLEQLKQPTVQWKQLINPRVSKNLDSQNGVKCENNPGEKT